MSFVYFQVDVHYLYQWIKGSSLLVNNIHTLYCTSLSNVFYFPSFKIPIDRLKQASLLQHQLQVFTLQYMVTMYLLHANTLITVLGNKWLIPLSTPLHVIKHCPY